MTLYCRKREFLVKIWIMASEYINTLIAEMILVNGKIHSINFLFEQLFALLGHNEDSG